MKRIVIMGASTGMGLALAEAFASRRVKVGLAARHTETFMELKNKYPGYVEYQRIDITHPKAVEDLNELIDKLGGMDIYFHSAGIGYENLTLDPEREVQIVRTNAEGFARMISAAYRYFRRHGSKGQIAALTSVAGTAGIGRLSAYSATKAFDRYYLQALEQLAIEEGADIKFTDIRPGWVKTPLIMEGRKYPMEMDTDYVVPLIIKAIVRRERVAVIDWRWNVVVGLWRLIPSCLWVKMKIKISEPDTPLPKLHCDCEVSPSDNVKDTETQKI